MTLLAVLLAGALGILDLVTGYELSFSIFYLAPVALAAWYGGRWSGLLLCTLSAGIWIGADLAGGQTYSHAMIPVWNTLVRLGFFSITSWLVGTLQVHLNEERRLARRDALTGALNSRAFTETLALAGRLAARTGEPLALAYLDLDNFKQVNDQLGHSEGDRVLRVAAQRIMERLRATDSLGRLGGDEFAIVLPATGLAGAGSLMEHVIGALSESLEAERWPVGCSAGVAVFQPPPPDADGMIRRADALMYRVKREGKGRLLVENYRGGEVSPSVS